MLRPSLELKNAKPSVQAASRTRPQARSLARQLTHKGRSLFPSPYAQSICDSSPFAVRRSPAMATAMPPWRPQRRWTPV